MTLTCSTKKTLVALIAIIISANTYAQVTQGRVVFERRTNLMKLFKDDKRIGEYLTEKNKYRNEQFELIFNESGSAFKYIEPETEEGPPWMKMLTQHHPVYQNLNDESIMVLFDFFGSKANMKDSVTSRTWKITDRTREFGGYECIRAIWEMNDSTRIYAWFSPDIVPVSGPEGMHGLPGLILGLATEDGSIIYKAKEIEIVEVTDEMVACPKLKDDVYGKEELIALLTEQMSRWRKPEEIRAMFNWY